MARIWLRGGLALALATAMTCPGCGPSTTAPEPGKAPSSADYKAEMEKQQGILMGDQKPAPPPADDKGKAATEEKAKEEKAKEEAKQ